MDNNEQKYTSTDELIKKLAEQEQQIEELRYHLEEAAETIDAIRTGQIDAIVVKGEDGHQLYTLRTADKTYRVFIEKMTEGAVTLNQQGMIIYSNTQFANMIRTPLSRVIGVSFDKFIAPEYAAEFSRLFKQGWSKDGKEEVLLITGNTKTAVQLSFTTLELAEGTALSVIVTDLTYQKAIQQQLQDNYKQLQKVNHELETSNHDLQQFASVASHDLQEPLRKIQIFTNLLKEQEIELTPDSKSFVDKIIESAARMKTLIIDILNYSRLSANDIPLEKVVLSEVFDELIEDFELLIAEKNAKVVSESLPVIEANRGQMRQMFQNIISNALKFSKSDISPKITVSSKTIALKAFNSPEQADGQFSLISIKDNGIGFDEKYLKNIFSLFERLNSKDKYEGTGIGMAITKKIVEKHNGLITAKSNEGEGAEFQIILPIMQNHRKS